MAEEKKEFRSKKKLKCTAAATAYQKAYFFDLKERVERGEKCGYLNADVPMEILRAMDIPFVVNQWWTALSAAKQMNAQYFELMAEKGYRGDICTYCAGALGASMLPDKSTAPWGGLPKISFTVTRLTCDCQMKIFDLLSKQYGAKFYPMENTTPLKYDTNWFDMCHDNWEDMFEPDRLDAMVADLRGLITFLEMETGKMFDMNKFIKMMNLINEQEMWFEKARQLLLNCGFTTVSQADLTAAILIPQWHRGTEWARDQAKSLYEELKERVDKGEKQIPNERIRMESKGRGLWFNQGFFQYFEEKYGLVFPGISHLTFASHAYMRNNVEKDPLRALAARYGIMEDVIHTPPWNNCAAVADCKEGDIDAVMYIVSSNCMLAVDGSNFQINELERAGIPVFAVRLDPTNAKAWNQDEMTKMFEEFIETRVLPRKREKEAERSK